MVVKKYISHILFSVLFFALGVLAGNLIPTKDLEFVNEATSLVEPQTPYNKYSIEALAETSFPQTDLTIGEQIKLEDEYASYKFSITFDPAISFTEQGTPEKKSKVTGQIHIPAGSGPFPVIVMYRGYVDPNSYITGMGTRPSAEFYARNGFITVAPDFLGYGDSDINATNIFESRFQTYTTALASLKSVDSLEFWDRKNIFLWGHSNGGHISMAVLEITGGNYPATLWAPVSKSFPYSILVYTDEVADQGKFIRSELSKFESLYDVNKFTITNYFDRIKAPVQLHQGTYDSEIELEWSNELANALEKYGVDVTYHVYPGTDHQLRPAWDTVVARDVEFFRKHMK